MIKIFFTCCILILITSCASMIPSYVPQRMGQLSIGMEKSDVLKIMEVSPTDFKAHLNTEYLIYKTHWGDYFVRFENGKVNAYGNLGDFDSTKDSAFNINIKSETINK